MLFAQNGHFWQGHDGSQNIETTETSPAETQTQSSITYPQDVDANFGYQNYLGVENTGRLNTQSIYEGVTYIETGDLTISLSATGKALIIKSKKNSNQQWYANFPKEKYNSLLIRNGNEHIHFRVYPDGEWDTVLEKNEVYFTIED